MEAESCCFYERTCGCDFYKEVGNLLYVGEGVKGVSLNRSMIYSLIIRRIGISVRNKAEIVLEE